MPATRWAAAASLSLATQRIPPPRHWARSAPFMHMQIVMRLIGGPLHVSYV